MSDLPQPNDALLWYLAAPYSKSADLEARTMEIDRAAAWLWGRGIVCYSPITHTHRIANHLGDHRNSEFWVSRDKVFWPRCDGLIALLLDGWRESAGMAEEFSWFKASGKRLCKMTADPYGLWAWMLLR